MPGTGLGTAKRTPFERHAPVDSAGAGSIHYLQLRPVLILRSSQEVQETLGQITGVITGRTGSIRTSGCPIIEPTLGITSY
jgi:hypothetical protein